MMKKLILASLILFTAVNVGAAVGTEPVQVAEKAII